jgi:hypothetical protein
MCFFVLLSSRNFNLNDWMARKFAAPRIRELTSRYYSSSLLSHSLHFSKIEAALWLLEKGANLCSNDRDLAMQVALNAGDVRFLDHLLTKQRVNLSLELIERAGIYIWRENR